MNTSNIQREAVQAALFRCGRCGHTVELPADTIGKKAKCPECCEISRVGPAEPMIEIIEESESTQQESSPTPSRERKSGSQAQKLPPDDTDVDSLAMSYLGRAQTESTRQKPSATEPASVQHCPHCHQVMPAKCAPAPAPIALAKPAVAQVQSRPAPARPAVASPRPAPAPVKHSVAQAQPHAAPAKPPVAPTQRAVRHSEMTGARPASVPVRPLADPTMRCPYCRETILLAARKCKHCGEFLDDTLRCLSEPNNNTKRRDNSGRSAPEDNGSNSLQELWYRIGPVKLAVAVLVVAGLSYVGIHFLGAKTTVAAPAVAAGSAEATMGEDKVAVAKDALSKLTSKIEKQLEGTSVRSAAGSVLNFENNDKGVVPWGCELDGSGKTLKGRITVPFKIDSSERTIPSGRGRYVLEVASRGGGQWELQSVTKETHVLIKGGAETAIPDEDRPSTKQQDGDFAVVHFKKTLSKLGPPPSDS